MSTEHVVAASKVLLGLEKDGVIIVKGRLNEIWSGCVMPPGANLLVLHF